MTFALLTTAFLVVLGGSGWAMARPTAVADLRRMVRAGMPEPEGPAREIEDSQCRRYRWGAVGGTVGGSIGAMTAFVSFELGMMTMAAGVMLGRAVGAALSQVTRRADPLSGRTAALQPRRWSDYLSPLELAATSFVVVLSAPVAVMVLRLGADRFEAQWLLTAMVSTGSLTAALLLTVVARQVLSRASVESTAASLLWREWLRARTLRDLCGAVMGMSFWSAYVTLVGLDWGTAEVSLADAAGPALKGLVAVLLVALVVGWAYATSDATFRRFRSRVMVQVLT